MWMWSSWSASAKRAAVAGGAVEIHERDDLPRRVGQGQGEQVVDGVLGDRARALVAEDRHAGEHRHVDGIAARVAGDVAGRRQVRVVALQRADVRRVVEVAEVEHRRDDLRVDAARGEVVAVTAPGRSSGRRGSVRLGAASRPAARARGRSGPPRRRTRRPGGPRRGASGRRRSTGGRRRRSRRRQDGSRCPSRSAGWRGGRRRGSRADRAGSAGSRRRRRHRPRHTGATWTGRGGVRQPAPDRCRSRSRSRRCRRRSTTARGLRVRRRSSRQAVERGRGARAGSARVPRGRRERARRRRAAPRPAWCRS